MDGKRLPAGFWISEKKDTVVRIEPCGDALCGYISWVHPDEEQLTPAGEPLCEQKVLWGFEESSSEQGFWRGGRIYRADKDKEYSGRIRVQNDDEIEVHGYIGLPFLGKTYTLTRVRESEYPSCTVPTPSLTGIADE
ncbi:MAG: DUF2147 domain-containing protein [Gammaproteobacteria bacterium]